MHKLIQSFEKHLKESLAIVVTVRPWEAESNLPFFLRNLYHFYQVSLFGKPCLLMVARDEAEQTPAVVRKHLSALTDRWEDLIIYVHPLVSSYNRKRLIHHKVPFVIPGNQIYLPDLGIELREHFRQVRSAVVQFAPSTQAVILHLLLHDAETYTPSGLASQLGYTTMTMSRAFDEIESAGLGEMISEGRERLLRPGVNKRDIWEDAQPFLLTPVKEKVWVEMQAFTSLHSGMRPNIEAGIAALAHYTDLAPPLQPIYALGGDEWKALKQRGAFLKAASAEPGIAELEIWRYAPDLFASRGRVDRLSLYLSLRETRDERVEAALEQMMGQLPW